MNIQKWNDSWKFWREKDSFALIWNIPENARNITLPHDAMMESPARPDSKNGGNTGYRDGDIYIYAKTIYVSEEDRAKTQMVKFEGIYRNAFVYVNGQLAAKCPFGYTTFYVKLNDFLKYGQENEIRVQVRAGAMPDSRWYSGAGIYRDVYWLEGGIVYIVPDGVQVQTENADPDYAELQVRTELKNRKHTVESLLLETMIQDEAGTCVAEERTLVTLFEGESRTVRQRVTVREPGLWSADTPRIYTCISRLYSLGNEDGGNKSFVNIKKDDLTVLDVNEVPFGIRTLQVNARQGFRVNGIQVKLRGACIHHDSGLLGAATYEEAQFRQILKLKEAGFNAVRMSHHPMAPAMLRACDKIGMYVMDELSDMWNQCKSDYDYALYFREWWEKDVTAMVQKDYNHPSVVLYSVGNEIPEIGMSHGAKTCQAIVEKIRELDETRFTLASINGIFTAGTGVNQIMSDLMSEKKSDGEGKDKPVLGNVNDFMAMQEAYMDEIVTHDMISRRLETACAPLDVAGYNYMTARYEPDGKNYPNRVIVGSETYPPEIAGNWKLVKKHPYLIGDFTWTGWDYLGEAGIGIPGYAEGEGGFGARFPAQLAFCGDLDITGWRRPVSYYREIVFGRRKTPYLAVQNPYGYGKKLWKTPWVMSDAVSSWSWAGYEGRPIVVEVYSCGNEVELLVNGKTLGRKPAGESEGFRTLYETTYSPGKLTAITYQDGREIGRMELSTPRGGSQLILARDDYTGREIETHQLTYITVEIRDEEGTLITDSDRKLTVKVEGGAELAGFGSGDPKPVYHYQEGVAKTYYGRALLILKKSNNKEPVKVMVSDEDGMSGILNL